jgi:hypothetical protein
MRSDTNHGYRPSASNSVMEPSMEKAKSNYGTEEEFYGEFRLECHYEKIATHVLRSREHTGQLRDAASGYRTVHSYVQKLFHSLYLTTRS